MNFHSYSLIDVHLSLERSFSMSIIPFTISEMAIGLFGNGFLLSFRYHYGLAEEDF